MFIGLLGAILLFLGVLAPMVSLSISGTNENLSVSYLALRNIELIQYGGADGIFVLIIAILSGVLVFYRKYKILYITAIVAISTMFSTCFTIHNQLSKLGMVGNLIELFIQLQWGCVVLILGSVMLIVSAYTGRDKLNNDL